MKRAALLVLAAAAFGQAPESPPGELRDIAGPVEMPEDPRWPLYAGAGACGAVAASIAGYLLHRRRAAARARAAELARRPRPPHEIALEALAALDLTVPPRLLYTRLTDILRGYIERRFAIDAPDATSSELLGLICRSEELHADAESLLRDLFAEADLVKFAAFVPARDASVRAIDACRSFVRQTKGEVSHAL